MALLTAMLAAFVVMTGYPVLLVQAMLSIPQIGFSEITALAGLGLYLVVGVIGTGLTAQFYHHFEIRASKPYKGIVTNGLAWTHLVLMNVGVAATSLLMIYAGYLGDIAIGEKEAGGFGMTIEQTSAANSQSVHSAGIFVVDNYSSWCSSWRNRIYDKSISETRHSNTRHRREKKSMIQLGYINLIIGGAFGQYLRYSRTSVLHSREYRVLLLLNPFLLLNLAFVSL